MIRVQIDNHVAEVTLANPPGNRFGWAMLNRLGEVIDEIESDDSVRSVLLLAEGDNFSHGADLRDSELASRLQSSEGAREVDALGRSLVERWRSLPVPTVVAWRGHAVGAGAAFVLVSDFRIAFPDSMLRFPEVARGMHLSWGLIPRLIERLGGEWARRMALGGMTVQCDRLTPPFVRLVEENLEEAGRDRAANLARFAPLAVRAIKSAILEEEGALRFPERDEQRFVDTVRSEDFAEAMTAWAMKRIPRYQGK